MGMGEPLLNLRAVTAAARFINQDLGIGARHITVSSVGVPNAIKMLASHLKEHSLQLTLAVSIHAPSQAVRQRIIPRLVCNVRPIPASSRSGTARYAGEASAALLHLLPHFQLQHMTCSLPCVTS